MTVPAKNEPASIFTNLKLVIAIALTEKNILLGMDLRIKFIGAS